MASIPEEAGEVLVNKWMQLQPPTIELLEKYWRKVEPELPLIDLMNAVYCAGHGECSFTGTGLFDRNTGESHGVDRAVMPGEYITISSTKFGHAHGLYFAVGPQFVCVTLEREDQELAEFKFDFEFKELVRHDPHHLLLDLTPFDFKPITSEFEPIYETEARFQPNYDEHSENDADL